MNEKENYVYDFKCPITGRTFFRISGRKIVYTHAVCSAKGTKSWISMHESLAFAEKTAKTKERKGYITAVIPITYAVRMTGSKVPKKRIKTEPILEEHLATASVSFDGVSEGYNEASHGHGSVGIGNWSKRTDFTPVT